MRIFIDQIAANLHNNGVNPGDAKKYAAIAKAAIKAGTDYGTAIHLARQAYYVDNGFHWHLHDWPLIQQAKRNAVRGHPNHTLLATEPHLAAAV